jgi:hypothetical protein
MRTPMSYYSWPRKYPTRSEKRVLQRPDAFRRIATLDDRRLDEVLEFLGKEAE